MQCERWCVCVFFTVHIRDKVNEFFLSLIQVKAKVLPTRTFFLRVRLFRTHIEKLRYE